MHLNYFDCLLQVVKTSTDCELKQGLRQRKRLENLSIWFPVNKMIQISTFEVLVHLQVEVLVAILASDSSAMLLGHKFYFTHLVFLKPVVIIPFV